LSRRDRGEPIANERFFKRFIGNAWIFTASFTAKNTRGRIHRYSRSLLIRQLESNWIIEIQIRVMALFERERIQRLFTDRGALIVSQSQFPGVINYFAQFRETIRCKLIGIYLNARGCL